MIITPSVPVLRVALLGCGSVGSQVARLLTTQAAEFQRRAGARLELAGIAVRRPGHPRPELDPAVSRDLLTADAQALAARPDVDLVVELIGGIEPARTLLLTAMKHGKSVVTGNKALLAENGTEIFGAAREYGTDLYYEASVAGAIPLLRPLRESLAGDTVHRVTGIVNGTTNFILDRMDGSGAGFAESLEEAQALGYAEADPTADVEGFDAAAKAAILAGLAFHTPVPAAGVHREGITEVTAADIASARALGRVVKLLAICERRPEGVSVRVHPAMIPRTHPLASVGGAYNAVFVEAEAAGRLMFYGAGAGGTPTASAVLGDLVAVARNRLAGVRGPDFLTHAALPVLPMGRARTRYHVSLDVDDRPGVLAPVADAYAQQGVSIQTVRQVSVRGSAVRGGDARDSGTRDGGTRDGDARDSGTRDGGTRDGGIRDGGIRDGGIRDGGIRGGRAGEDRVGAAQLMIVTHAAADAALAATIRSLEALPVVRSVASVMRVEGEDE